MSTEPTLSAQLDEAEWYQRVYRGDEPQLTVRAVATGLALGFVFSLANVYIGLKAGWFFSMAFASILVSFAGWRALAAIGLARRPLSLLETNCMQSTASSAAYATGNMVVGVIPAMLLLSVSPAHPAGEQRSWLALAAWIACIGALGVTLAIPLKRQLINRERLAFPSGTAAAIMLHGMYETGARVRTQARLLFAAIGAGALLPILRDLRAVAVLPASSRIFDWLPRFSAGGATYAPSDAGLVLDHSVLLVAAGVFVGLRVALWMVIGGLITAFVLAPIGIAGSVVSRPGLAWLDVGIWIGAPLLVAHSLVAFAASWRDIARTFVRRRRRDEQALAIEIPAAWFWIGFAACGTAAIALAHFLFDIPILLGAVAVLLAIVFANVACRITGETDVNPGGALGKLTQLAFGVLRPQHPTTNLMAAAMTHASSVAAADLLNDLKSGYLLGAHPRKQFVAQAAGILAGTAASVLAYFVLVPDATALAGTADHAPQFAAPAAHQFMAIAELLEHGLDALHPLQRALVVLGAAAGVALSCAERFAPRPVACWLPSAAGLGLGLLLPLASSLSMLIGAAIAAIAGRVWGIAAERHVWPIAAGALAGESLVGVAVTLANQAL